MEKFDVVVVGAGAAGLIAAGRAASLGAKVLLIEKMRQEGRKLLITGKGRCNITNEATISEFIKHVYPNGKFLKPAFSNFYNKDIIELLNEQGVETVAERGGRIFPKSNRAADVVNALTNWAKKQGVSIRCGCKLDELKTENDQVYGLIYTQKEIQQHVLCNSLILCTGGLSYPATGSKGDGHKIAQKLNHTIETTRPALVPVETKEKIHPKLEGLNLRNVKAVVWSDGRKINENFGELIFESWGLNGPIILTLSRNIVDEFKAGKNVEVSIDLKPALDEQKLDTRLLRDIDTNGKTSLFKLFKSWMPMQLIPAILDRLELDPQKEAHQLSGKERRKIRILLKDFRFKISGHRSFKEAIITAGGVKTSDINAKTMESKLTKNLYFAGELIDVDADTGGYNLQIAFSTGWLAGSSCVKE